MLFDYMLVYDYSFYMSGLLLMAAAVVMVIPWRYTNNWQRAESVRYRPAAASEPSTAAPAPATGSDRAALKAAEAERSAQEETTGLQRGEEEEVGEQV